MKNVGVDAAGERFGGFAKFGMDAAESVGLQEDTAAVGLVVEAMPGFAEDSPFFDEQRLRGVDAVRGGPVLLFDTATFFVGDDDAMLAATSAARMAGPVLDGREFEREVSHGGCRVGWAGLLPSSRILGAGLPVRSKIVVGPQMQEECHLPARQSRAY